MVSCAGSFLWAVSAARQAGAQAEPPKPPASLPPVEVVATRVPKAPHDVTASIEVISGADLRARGVTSLQGALALAAGVAIAPGGDNGPASAVAEFWGLREFDAFLLVVDGVPWGGALNPAVAALSLRDVERVEILRGPAPVTYGATSFVGVIHVVHKAAAADATYLSASGGTFGSGSGAADFAIPAFHDWKSRLTADLDRTGFKDDRTSYSRGHALWRSSMVRDERKTWFTVDLNVLRQDPASPHVRDGPALSTATPLDANYNPAGAYLNQDRISLAAGWDVPVLDGAVWSTTASYAFSAQRMFRGFLTDISASQNNASGWKEHIDINDAYADTHIIWPMRSGVQFMAGADLLFANGDASGADFTYTALLSGSSAPNVAQPSILDVNISDQRLFLGAYGSAEWRPSDRFTLNAGLRLNSTTEHRGGGAQVSNTRLSGSLGALVGLWQEGANHVRLFANYRDTFKPAAVDFGLDEQAEVLKPETSTSYEGGVKIRTVDDRLDFEASVFHMDFNNLVTSTVVNNQPALINSGKTRYTGFELAADLRLEGDMHARASYSSHDAKFVDFVKTFDVPTQLAGKRIEMSAKELWSAGFTLSPDEGFIASVGVNYTGDRFMDMRNHAPTPGFSTYDAGIGYRTGRFEWRLDGKNLGDARDPVSESEFGDAQYYRMPSRTIQAGVVVKY